MSDNPIFNLNEDEIILISTIITSLSASSTACLLLHVILLFHEHRNPSLVEQHLNWQEQFMEKYGSRADFKRHLRMPLKSIDKLLSLIRPQLGEVDKEMVSLKGGPIMPELALFATLWYLAGDPFTLFQIWAICLWRHLTVYFE
jgi:hypothetical protein